MTDSQCKLNTYLCRYTLAAVCIRAITRRTNSAANTTPATTQMDKYSVGTSDEVSVRMKMKGQLYGYLAANTRHKDTVYMFPISILHSPGMRFL